MEHEPARRLIALGELHLCLGHALMPPRTEGHANAMQGPLMDDLRELSEATGIPGPERLRVLEEALQDAAKQPGGLLRTYARLFLVPPVPAPLNAGIQLEGTLMGGSTLALETLYQRYGLERDPAFGDLPDHLSLILQFLGYLDGLVAERADPAVAQDAMEVLDRYLLSWSPRWLEQLDEAIEGAPAAPAYRELAGLVHDAAQANRQALTAWVGAPAEAAAGEAEAAKPTLEAALSARGVTAGDTEAEAETFECQRCREPFLPGADFRFMVEKLTERGLAVDHLQVCPDCRASAMGMGTLEVTLPDQARKVGSPR